MVRRDPGPRRMGGGAAVILCLAGCEKAAREAPEPSPTSAAQIRAVERDPATREMAAMLREIAGKIDPLELPLVINDRRADRQLQGVRSNRSVIGARIKVTVDFENGPPRTICRVVSSGGSFGASPLRQEIGLRAATRLAAVEVHWPASGQTQKFEGLEMGKRYRIIEGDASPAPIVCRSFALSRATAERLKTCLGRAAD